MPACVDPILTRIEQLVDERRLTTSPASLTAIVDGLAAHVDHGCQVESLLLAMQVIQSASALRLEGRDRAALERLDVGIDLLRVSLLPQPSSENLDVTGKCHGTAADSAADAPPPGHANATGKATGELPQNPGLGDAAPRGRWAAVSRLRAACGTSLRRLWRR